MDRITIVSFKKYDVEELFNFIDSFYIGEGINKHLKKMTALDIGMIQAYVRKVLFSKYEEKKCFMYACVRQAKFMQSEENITFRDLYNNRNFWESNEAIKVCDGYSMYIDSLIKFFENNELTEQLNCFEVFLKNIMELENIINSNRRLKISMSIKKLHQNQEKLRQIQEKLRQNQEKLRQNQEKSCQNQGGLESSREKLCLKRIFPMPEQILISLGELKEEPIVDEEIGQVV